MNTPENSNPAVAIGSRIRERRNHLGLKQSDVAKELGMTMQAISLWENGKVSPGGNNVSKLAKILQCDVSWLLEGVTVEEKDEKMILNHESGRVDRRIKRTIEAMQEKTLGSYIPQKFKDSLDYAEELHNLMMLFCDLDESRRGKVLLYTIENWKENAAEEIARVDNIYKNLKDDLI